MVVVLAAMVGTAKVSHVRTTRVYRRLQCECLVRIGEKKAWHITMTCCKVVEEGGGQDDSNIK